MESTSTDDRHFCAHCGTENAKGGYACTRCGERLIEISTETSEHLSINSCSRCGSANNTKATYCWVCGSETKDSIRIAPKAPLNLQIPSAVTPRTYRPDLNPASGPAGKRVNENSDLRGPVLKSERDIQSNSSTSYGDSFGSPDSPAENTSGIKGGELPSGVKKWNWAAFLMPAVWGLFSGVPYTAILFGAAFLPPTIQLVVMVVASVYLGVKGNELAWRGKKWQSVEQFNAFQKQWASWAVKLTVAVAALLVLYVISTGGA